MKRFWSVASIIVIISILLIGCSGKNDEKNGGANENEELNGQALNEEEEELTEVDSNQNEVGENNSNENLEEETFADEVRILSVETVLLDQDEVSEFKANEDTVIEHDGLLYVEHDFISEVLDYELTYDEENTFAEIFKSKGDFSYEPTHENEGGALMDLGQIYVEDIDNYENISAEEQELYKFIEYEGKLYVSERLINVYMKSPVNYERRDQILELGLLSEAIEIYDVGIKNGSPSTEVTQNASDVTVKGKNYDGGIIIRDVNSADKNAQIDIDYNYSNINGFVYNKSDKETIEFKFQYDDDKTLDSVNVKPGETHKFDFDVKGESIFKVIAKGSPGSSSEVVIIGELK